jgi:hypothetical protein
MSQFKLAKVTRKPSCVTILNKQKCHFFSFTKLENRRVEQVLYGSLSTSGRQREDGEWVWEGEYSVNTVYVNGKMVPVEAISGMEVKKNGGGGEFKYELFDILQELIKCHNVPPSSTSIMKTSFFFFLLPTWK